MNAPTTPSEIPLVASGNTEEPQRCHPGDLVKTQRNHSANAKQHVLKQTPNSVFDHSHGPFVPRTYP